MGDNSLVFKYFVDIVPMKSEHVYYILGLLEAEIDDSVGPQESCRLFDKMPPLTLLADIIDIKRETFVPSRACTICHCQSTVFHEINLSS